MTIQKPSNLRSASMAPATPSKAGHETLMLSGLEIEIVRDGDRYVGLGRISTGKVDLRSGRLPMSPEIRTPDGLELGDWRITDLQRASERIEIALQPTVRSGGLMEWMVHETRPRVRIDDWTQPAKSAQDTKLRLRLTGQSRHLNGFDGVGLTYQYQYQSDSMPIYRIFDRGSWEPGGTCVGGGFWQRAGVPPITRFESVEDDYSTEWYLPSARNPHVFQFQPWQTHLQGFSFATSEQGVLVTWASRVAHIRSLFEKRAGWAEMLHLHEHCQDLAGEWSTSPVEVLWFEGVTDRVDQINLYEAVRDLVHETLHDQVGMRRDRVTTYGMMEEWANADLQRYADRGVPKMLDAGVRTIGLANHFSNHMNTFGVSNMCCTYDLRVAESVGEENLQALCEKVKAGGARTEMWANTALSTLALLLPERNGRRQRIDFPEQAGSIMEALKDAEDPFVRTPSDAIEADHYTPRFAVMNLRDPDVRSIWLRSWKDLHDRIGVDDFFLDSSFNLSSDKFHWINNASHGNRHGGTIDQVDLRGHRRGQHELTPAILSQYRAHLELVAAMQKLGYRYNGEDLGVFGVSRTGPRVADRLNNLFIWPECLAEFDVRSLEAAGADPDDVFFRGLAYRMMWTVFWHPPSDELSFQYRGNRDDRDRPAQHHVAWFHAFNRVNDLMRNRCVLPDEQGVVYRPDGRQQVVWAFEDFAMDLPAELQIHALLESQTQTGRTLHARRHRVYLIEPDMESNA